MSGALPYGSPATEGYSETETSRQFALDERATAGQRQEAVLDFIRLRRARGATVTEIKDRLIPHHGTASRCLTVLHMTGQLVRLREVRGNAKVYVLPEYRATRAVERYVGSKARHEHDALAGAVRAVRALAERPAPSEAPTYRLGRSEALSEAVALLEELMVGSIPADPEPARPTEEEEDGQEA